MKTLLGTLFQALSQWASPAPLSFIDWCERQGFGDPLTMPPERRKALFETYRTSIDPDARDHHEPLLSAVVFSVLVAGVTVADAQDCSRPWIDQSPVPIARTVTQEAAILEAAARIVPRRADGTPDSVNGKVVLVLIGMSNTAGIGEGLRYHLSRTTPDVHPQLVFINGAQGGKASAEWADPTCNCWTVLADTLAKQGVAAQQVGLVASMMTRKHPKLAPAGNTAQFLEEMRTIHTRAETLFPFAELHLPGANYYGGYDTNQDKTPEPHQFEQARSIQALQDTWTGKPMLGWHAWTDGERVRWDGLYLTCADMAEGGVHQAKAAKRRFGAWLRDWLWELPIAPGLLRQ